MSDNKVYTLSEDGVSMVGGSPVLPTNNVSDGAIEGIGVGPKGEPGVSKRNRKRVMPFKSMFKRVFPGSSRTD